MTQPSTSLHYILNASPSGGVWAPQALGFNVADVSSVSTLNSLPTGILGIVYTGYSGGGADATFINMVTPFVGNARVYAFYLADEPDITNSWGTYYSIVNLKAQSDYIRAHFPGVKTFIVLSNQGSSNNPNYTAPQGAYNPATTGIDLYAIDPYPKRTDVANGFDTSIIGKAFTAAVASGVPAAQLVPMYQAFGNYPPWTAPTAAEELQILDAWGAVLPNPVLDSVYSWGIQNNAQGDPDTALVSLTDLQPVFQAHNAVVVIPPPPLDGDGFGHFSPAANSQTVTISFNGTLLYAYPAAIALHNLTTILADGGANAWTFSTSRLGYSLSNMPSDGRSWLSQRSDGVFELIAWNEPAVQTTTAPVADFFPTSTTVTITFTDAVTSVRVFDPMIGTNAQSTFLPIAPATMVPSATFALAGGPKIIQITKA